MTSRAPDATPPRAPTARLCEVVIERLAAGGAGVAHLDGRVIFVDGGLPGDHVRVRLLAEHPRYARGTRETLLEASPLRRTPPCALAEQCGGCPWMALPEDAQNSARTEAVAELVARVGGLPRDRVRPTLAASQPLEYRNRLRLMAIGDRVGFRRASTHEVVDIPSCVVARPRVNRGLEALRTALQPLLPLRSPLMIELQEDAEGQLEVAISGPDAPRLADLSLRWEGIPAPVRLRLFAAPTAASSPPRLPFQQANPEMNAVLVRLAREALQPTPGTQLLDLYCGDGNLSLPLVGQVASVLGLESNREAVSLARAKAEAHAAACGPLHAHRPASYLARSAEDGVAALVRAGRRFDRILLDPPRTGALEVCRHLGALQPERVVYVSCDPATLARDLRVLEAQGLRVSFVQPLELMPQTAHVECVALLEREDEGG